MFKHFYRSSAALLSDLIQNFFFLKLYFKILINNEKLEKKQVARG